MSVCTERNQIVSLLVPINSEKVRKTKKLIQKKEIEEIIYFWFMGFQVSWPARLNYQAQFQKILLYLSTSKVENKASIWLLSLQPVFWELKMFTLFCLFIDLPLSWSSVYKICWSCSMRWIAALRICTFGKRCEGFLNKVAGQFLVYEPLVPDWASFQPIVCFINPLQSSSFPQSCVSPSVRRVSFLKKFFVFSLLISRFKITLQLLQDHSQSSSHFALYEFWKGNWTVQATCWNAYSLLFW